MSGEPQKPAPPDLPSSKNETTFDRKPPKLDAHSQSDNHRRQNSNRSRKISANGGPIRLQRIVSSGRTWFPEIDGLRFIAIASVLLTHIFGETVYTHAGLAIPVRDIPFSPQLEHLARGVQLFFILSGFVLARPFLQHLQDGRPGVSLKSFYARRLTRLEPPYILSVVLYTASLIFVHHDAARPVLKSATLSLFYIHNFFRYLPPVNNSAWSLEVEVEFYLIMPLLALIFAVRSPALRRTVLVLAAIPCIILFHPFAIDFVLPSQMPFFLAGLLLADLRVLEQTARNLWADALALALWISVPFIKDEWGYAPLVIVLTAAFALSLRGRILRSVLSTRWIALLGGMCYSIYLLHMLVIAAIFPLSRHAMVFHGFALNYLSQVVILFPAVCIAGLGYFVLIERPCMDPEWPRNLLQRAQTLRQSERG